MRLPPPQDRLSLILGFIVTNVINVQMMIVIVSEAETLGSAFGYWIVYHVGLASALALSCFQHLLLLNHSCFDMNSVGVPLLYLYCQFQWRLSTTTNFTTCLPPLLHHLLFHFVVNMVNLHYLVASNNYRPNCTRLEVLMSSKRKANFSFRPFVFCCC